MVNHGRSGFPHLSYLLSPSSIVTIDNHEKPVFWLLHSPDRVCVHSCGTAQESHLFPRFEKPFGLSFLPCRYEV